MRYLREDEEGPRLRYVAVMTVKENLASKAVAQGVEFLEFRRERRVAKVGGEGGEGEGEGELEVEARQAKEAEEEKENTEEDGRRYLGEETWIGFMPEVPAGVVFGERQ